MSQQVPRSLLILISAFCLQIAFAAEPLTVSHLKATDDFSGVREYQFPPDTRLSVPGSMPEVIVLDKFTGNWVSGMPQGRGILYARLVRLAADNATVKAAASKDPITASMALTAIDRVRTEAALLGKNPDEAERIVFRSDVTVPLVLEGNFEQGEPIGTGVLQWGEQYKIEANMTGWAPHGPAMVSFEGKLLATFNLDWKNGPALANGPLSIIMRMPFGTPAAMYTGAYRDGSFQGGWTEFRWAYDGEPGLHVSGIDHRMVVADHQWVFYCDLPAVQRPDPMSALYRASTAYRITTDGLFPFGPFVSGTVGHGTCKSRRDNWSYELGIDFTPFGGFPNGPNSCTSPNGYKGTVEIGGGRLACSAYEPADDIFDKVADFLTKPVAKAFQPAVNAMDSAFRNITKDFCRAFGYEEGVNCSVNTNGTIVRMTYQLPEKRAVAAAPATARHADAQLAKVRAAPNYDSHSLDGYWAQMLQGCVYYCPDSIMPFADASADELIKAMQGGFEQDLQRNRLAFLRQTAQVLALIGAMQQTYQVGHEWYAIWHVQNLIEDEYERIKLLKAKYPSKTPDIDIVLSRLANAQSREGAIMTLSAVQTTFDAIQDTIRDKALDKVLDRAQLLQVIRLSHEVGFDSVALMKQLSNLHSEEEFWAEFFKQQRRDSHLPLE